MSKVIYIDRMVFNLPDDITSGDIKKYRRHYRNSVKIVLQDGTTRIVPCSSTYLLKKLSR